MILSLKRKIMKPIWTVRDLRPYTSFLKCVMEVFKNFSIVSWNIRGALGSQSRRHVRDLVNLHHPSVFLIFETHGPFAKVEQLWTALGYKPLFLQEARGHSGGIWVLSCCVDVSFSLIDTSFQAITFSVHKRNVTWCCTATYASPIPFVRAELWDHLSQLRSRINVPWVLLGDLNEILHQSEVAGGSFCCNKAQLLASMMANCGFIDLDTIGGLFTWRKNISQGRHVRKRLDRCMADADWRLLFQHAMVEVLNPHNSDHNPLLLSCLKCRSHKVKSFHFQAAWISHPLYGTLVDNTWKYTPGDALAKLRGIKNESIVFNNETFGNIFRNKRILEARIKGVHRHLDSYPWSDLIKLEKDLQLQYNKVLAQEELLWYQKSRENWVKFGNKNTKFFHTQTIIRRRRNMIAGLNIDGT